LLAGRTPSGAFPQLCKSLTYKGLTEPERVMKNRWTLRKTS